MYFHKMYVTADIMFQNVRISLDFTCTYIIRVVEENVLDTSYCIACPVTGLGVTVITTISGYFRHIQYCYTGLEEPPWKNYQVHKYNTYNLKKDSLSQ